MATWNGETLLDFGMDIREGDLTITFEAGALMVPTFQTYDTGPTLYARAYVHKTEGRRRKSTMHCFSPTIRYELDDAFMFGGDLVMPSVNLDEWVVFKVFDVINFDAETREHIIMYVQFSSQPLPDSPRDYPKPPSFQSIDVLEDMSLFD
ncbi:MAG: hypothetical protein AAF267_08380 [Deinococcota bacterium]